MTKITLGILGGGQLAMLSCLAAKKLGIDVVIYCDVEDSPAFSVCQKYFHRSYDDVEALKEFADVVDFISYEFENIPTRSLEVLAEKKELYPDPAILSISQNRIREKEFINSIGIKTADYCVINSLTDLQRSCKQFAYQAILKTTELGYDGKGQYSINEKTDLESIWSLIKKEEQVMVLENKVNFAKEISVIVARSKNGDIKLFPAAENQHDGGVLRKSIVPATISSDVMVEANKIASKIAIELDLVGILAVEMFLTNDDELLVNEVAPRPHNSGHYTLDACNYSQFTQFVLAVTKQDLKEITLKQKAVMHNLLGEEILQEDSLKTQPNTHFYNYGKGEIKPGRKMGHYTVVG